MDDNKKNKSSKSWIIYGSIILLTVILVSVFASIYILSSNTNTSISYTWTDRSSGECEVIEGTYHGKEDTLYLHDDRINSFCSAKFSYEDLTEGTISFYIRFDGDVSGDIVIEFYEEAMLFSELDSIQDGVISSTWYLIDLKFDCETDSGEVWIDGHFIEAGDFTINEANYNDGFVIRTDSPGMINAYISMISIV